MTQTISLGKYRHYRTQKLYEVIGFARHSESYEEMVIYKALYHCEKFGKDHTWARPKAMFLEEVEHNSLRLKRFERVEQ